MAEGVAVRLLDGRPARCADVGEDEPGADVARELAQIPVVPGGLDALEDGGGVRDLAVPADAEAVAVRRLGTEPRMQALVDERVFGLVEQLLEQDWRSGVCEPAAHGLSSSCQWAKAVSAAASVRLVEQEEECGPGEPYDPLDVDLLFDDEPTVALRGPWNAFDLVKIGPRAEDLRNRFEYHLDFPGHALDPGCGYERWSRRLAEGREPTMYAHVATEAGYPGKVALQYWFFYAFNDFNNLHEGDWEMIQIVFDADDARDALDQEPVSVGYSSHEGAERASWDDDKLEVVDETHPVVYPSVGSHANKFTDALYLGSSADAGVGCDDTRGPHRELRPAFATIPSDPQLPRRVSRGSSSKDGGANSRRRFSTGRPART